MSAVTAGHLKKDHKGKQLRHLTRGGMDMDRTRLAIALSVALSLVSFAPAAAQDEPCDRLTFGDLTVGATYPSGTNFVTEGVTVSVSDFFYTVGPCGGPTTSGAASVQNLGDACGGGKEIEVNNVTLDFDFGGAVIDVHIEYGEYGGEVSLGVNGDCEVVSDFIALDGLALGGVAVKVFDFGVSGQGCGVIRLLGTITDLTIGGQELFIDNVTYCEECADLLRSAFEDRTLGESFNVGASFTSGAATHDVLQFYPPGGTCTMPTFNGFCEVQNGGLACGNGKELNINNVNVRIDFGVALDWLILNFGEYGGNVNLRINGDCRNVDDFSDLDNQLVGGVLVLTVDYLSCGNLYAVGLIEEFGIGGQELYIDNVRACPSALVAVPETRVTSSEPFLLEQNQPNPFRGATTISFELAHAARARLAIYDVAGRAVRTLIDEQQPPGRHEVLWDGRGPHGRRVSDGVYFYRLEVAGKTETRRLLVVD
jgi:hypothetical protein